MSGAPEALGGENLAFAEALYEQFLQDPASVDPAWRALFEPIADRGAGPAPLGPTFQPRSIFAPAALDGGYRNGKGNGTAIARAEQVAAGSAALRQERVDQLVTAFRALGHMEAQLDPLERTLTRVPELEPSYYGLTEADLDLPHTSRISHAPPGCRTIRDLLAHLRATYCRTIGVQFNHIEDAGARNWLQQRMESTENRLPLTHDEQVRLLTKLNDAEMFEQFIQKKYLGAKSFSLEGGESLIPMLDLALERAGDHGVEEIIIGMAHRGRLNVLANILHKSPGQIFREFEDRDPDLYWGRGDVKYHLGRLTDHVTSKGKKIRLTLCFNPSHLEFVSPVVEGRVRARQDRRPAHDRGRVMPLIMHGDAAFAGQGVVQELLNMSALAGYTIGGALHIIINNQIGFTTPPRSARSTRYATDVARMLQVPIFHVNGEDPEAVAQVVLLAMDFREQFREDVFIDLYCYRRHGHNEGDEPAYTQPLMYKTIRARPTVREAYVQKLMQQGLTQAQVDEIAEQRRQYLEDELARARAEGYAPEKATTQEEYHEVCRGGPVSEAPAADTSLPLEQARALLGQVATVPADVTPHPKLARWLEHRREMARGERPLDWAAAEALAFASLLTTGHRVRLSGQDSGRGTFSHRHAVLHDFETGGTYVPLQYLSADQAPFEVLDSPLSEVAVLGFEWGYSLETPRGLVLWEAQFGDFVNGAQVIVDQFISSAEDKWGLLSHLVMLLPHGFEGQGPEHSSARLERFLQLAAEDNMIIVNLTTPAQYFHALRRQVLSPWRKPLVVMSPKSLLRHPECTSTLEEVAGGAFQPVIPDPKAGAAQVLLCSGRLYYDLVAARAQHGRDDVAIVRLERLYPIDDDGLKAALDPHPGAPVTWVQEDPENMGGWAFLRARYGERLHGRSLACVARDESASPATGSLAAHKREQERLLERAFSAR
ncbi:MAG: 2-oxoglutarate dehydrogenase E1 component [Planctomycetes bacterium]|nr:2-oxoglutarate dehydrogenase E1 component [Planctomycetota bacterium]